MTWASDSPLVLMLSVPQSTRAIDSGYLPPFSLHWRSSRRSTTTLALWIAAAVGIACGKDVRVADWVPTRARLNVLAAEARLKRPHLVVLHHLKEAEVEVVEHAVHLILVRGGKPTTLKDLHVGLGLHPGEVEEVVHQGHVNAALVGDLVSHESLHTFAAGHGDLLEELNVLQDALVAVPVHL